MRWSDVELENVPENAVIYDDTDEYIIIDNRQMMPMIVWKEKNVTRDLKVSRTMKKAIQNVGEKKYGRGNFFIDRFHEGDEKYLTWYCRPNMNPELIKERSKNGD
ncbi:MAG: hypothetical protein VX898_05190 [Candidatus Thermoplasmatota archaeon]|nr:hypothetical protein [Candidatus Thermoplasmatota archaeon]